MAETNGGVDAAVRHHLLVLYQVRGHFWTIVVVAAHIVLDTREDFLRHVCAQL